MITERCFFLVRRLLLCTALCVVTEKVTAQEFNPGEQVEYKTLDSPTGWERGKILRPAPGGRQYIVIEKPNQFNPEGAQKAYSLDELRRPSKCAKCQAVLALQARFCGECGTPVPQPGAMKTCPACGNKQAEGAFCAKCGGKFDGTAGPQLVPAAPAPAPPMPATPGGGTGVPKVESPLSPEEAKVLNDTLGQAGSLKIEDLYKSSTYYRSKDGKMEAVEFFNQDETIGLLVEFKGKPRKGSVLTKFFLQDQLVSEAKIDLAELNKEVQIALPITINLGQSTRLTFTLKPATEWPLLEGYRAEVSVDGKPLGKFPFRVGAKGAIPPAPGTPAPAEPTAPKGGPDAPAPDANIKPMGVVAEAFLVMLDKGSYDASFDAADESFRKGLTKEAWAENLTKNRVSLGTPTARKFTKVLREKDVRTGSVSYVFPLESTFEKGSLLEEVTVVKSSDGQLRVSDYSSTVRK